MCLNLLLSFKVNLYVCVRDCEGRLKSIVQNVTHVLGRKFSDQFVSWKNCLSRFEMMAILKVIFK